MATRKKTNQAAFHRFLLVAGLLIALVTAGAISLSIFAYFPDPPTVSLSSSPSNPDSSTPVTLNYSGDGQGNNLTSCKFDESVTLNPAFTPAPTYSGSTNLGTLSSGNHSYNFHCWSPAGEGSATVSFSIGGGGSSSGGSSSSSSGSGSSSGGGCLPSAQCSQGSSSGGSPIIGTYLQAYPTDSDDCKGKGDNYICIYFSDKDPHNQTHSVDRSYHLYVSAHAGAVCWPYGSVGSSIKNIPLNKAVDRDFFLPLARGNYESRISCRRGGTNASVGLFYLVS